MDAADDASSGEPGGAQSGLLEPLTVSLPRGRRIALDWMVAIAGTIVIVRLIKAFVADPYRIASSSMEPTLHCARPGRKTRFSDRVLANRFIYHFRRPRRGEIISFNAPKAAAVATDKGSETLVKRVIGLPGDTIAYMHNVLSVNGKVIHEPYVEPDRAGGKQGTWRVPRKHFFLMGDNRSESRDSRVWGPVRRKDIVGEVFVTYWPPNRIAFHSIVPP